MLVEASISLGAHMLRRAEDSLSVSEAAVTLGRSGVEMRWCAASHSVCSRRGQHVTHTSDAPTPTSQPTPTAGR